MGEKVSADTVEKFMNELFTRLEDSLYKYPAKHAKNFGPPSKRS